MRTDVAFSVEELRRSDVSAVVSLAAELSLARWSEADYLAELGNPSALMFRLTAGRGKLAGFLAARRVPGEGPGLDFEINNIGIKREFQRNGGGRLLLGRLIEQAVYENAAGILLEVRAANRQATAFYKTLGFEAVGRRKNYYVDPPDDALVMKRVVEAATAAAKVKNLKSRRKMS